MINMSLDVKYHKVTHECTLYAPISSQSFQRQSFDLNFVMACARGDKCRDLTASRYWINNSANSNNTAISILVRYFTLVSKTIELFIVFLVDTTWSRLFLSPKEKIGQLRLGLEHDGFQKRQKSHNVVWSLL